jgi:hypothetical protein
LKGRKCAPNSAAAGSTRWWRWRNGRPPTGATSSPSRRRRRPWSRRAGGTRSPYTRRKLARRRRSLWRSVIGRQSRPRPPGAELLQFTSGSPGRQRLRVRLEPGQTVPRSAGPGAASAPRGAGEQRAASAGQLNRNKCAGLPVDAKKRAGKARLGYVSLLRLPSEGHASLRLGLRANAQGAFRTKPAWRPTAARGRFACRGVTGGKGRSRTPMDFSSACCAAAACPGVMEWQ